MVFGLCWHVEPEARRQMLGDGGEVGVFYIIIEQHGFFGDRSIAA